MELRRWKGLRWLLAFGLVVGHIVITGGISQAGIENYLDLFGSQSYSNDNGSLLWSGPWQEFGESSDPVAGDWQVSADTGFADYALEKKGPGGSGVQRMADLEGFSTATLNFDYRRVFLAPSKSIDVQVSAGGLAGPWTTVSTITGSAPPVTDPVYVASSIDITSFISSHTAVRFVHPSTSGSIASPMAIYIDDIEITGELTNRAPVLSGVGDLVGDEGSLIGFAAGVSDPDVGDGHVFSLAGSVPAGAVISSGGVFSWTPGEGQGPGDYTFDVVVTDDGVPALGDSETITITVNEVNTAPVVSDPGDRSNGEGDGVSVVVGASDSDLPADSLEWSAVGLPPGLSIGSSTGEISGVVDYSAAAGSPYSVVVTVSDGVSDDSVVFDWTVTETNRAPVLSGVGDLVGDEGSLIGFAAGVSDPDVGDGHVFSLAGSVPAGAVISSGGVFSWTPGEGQGPGDYTFDVVVTDDGVPALGDSETITITVNEVNTAPVVSDPGDRSNGEGDGVSVVVGASDSDLPADSLEWSAVGLPPGLSIGSSTGEISGVVDYSAAAGSPYSVVVTVSDGVSDDSVVFDWTVTETNRAPVLSGVGDLVGDEGSLIGFAAGVSDPDVGDGHVFSLAGSVPAGAVISSGGVFSWTPGEGQGPGDYTFDVVVTDDGVPALGDSETITITVNEVNTAPTAVDDRYSVTRGESVAVGAPGILANDSDADSNDLTAWLTSSPKHGEVDLNADGSFTYAHTGSDASDDSFTYRISDGNGTYATATVRIVVTSRPNQAPVVVGDMKWLEEDGSVRFYPLDNDFDPDGDVVHVTDVGTVQAGELILESDESLHFIPQDDFNGTVTTGYTVEDSHGAIATGDLTFVVKPVNDAPVANPDRVSITGYLSHAIEVLDNDLDVDGDPLHIVAVAQPHRGQVEVLDNTIVFTPSKGWVGSTYFTYVVSDGSSAQAEGVVEVDIPTQALVAARQLSSDLGTSYLKADFVPTVLNSSVDVMLSPLVGLQLFVKAFFQSLDGVELSLALLGATAVVLAGFAIVSRLPVMVPSSTRYWSAVLVGRESQLAIRTNPDRSSEVIYQLRPTTTGIESATGARLLPRGWMALQTPRGQGWAETCHLTAQVDTQAFMEDRRPVELTRRLIRRLVSRRDISRLVSKRGLIVELSGSLQLIDPETICSLTSRGAHEPIATPLRADFRSQVVSPFLDAFRASGDIDPDEAHSASALLPMELINFRYLAVGGANSEPWLVFFEYERGKPRIVGLLRDV